MYRWNTKRIVELLESVEEIEKVEVQMPGGDCDSEQIVCKVRGEDEHIFICGFCTEDNDPIWTMPYEEKGDVDVEMVEITDNSGHGLQSDSFQTATAYIKARQILVGGGATVVDHLKDYF